MSAKASTMAAPPPPKPIRFITNDGGPYAKRRRISSACLTCRRRKTRCSGERPVCGTCKEHGLQCGGYGAHGDAVGSPVSPQFGEPSLSPTTKRNSKAETVSSLGKRESQSDFESPKSSPTYGSSEDDQPRSAARSDRLGSQQSRLSLSVRNRMPYFRYFGPTAIMPGVRQMLVKVNEKAHSTSNPSEALGSPPGAVGHRTPSIQGHDAPTPLDPPVYDSSDIPPSPIITHLCETFFKHLGCTFPFLQKERFLRDLQEKQVDAILVDAVCALAARFSEDAHVKYGSNAPDGPSPSLKVEVPPPDRGQPFAQRAKLAMVDAYPCPSVAVVQAALLLAYDEFGANRDSGLWMYLGIAIRMAQDLGMQKTLGLRYMGLTGPTPQTVKIGKSRPIRTAQPTPPKDQSLNGANGVISAAEQREVERERIDTFWAVFFLDRAISSGTGRPVTLRDEEIEVAFPPLDRGEPENSWPHPFPALIRVVHLYGRVTDVLNGIKEASQVTPDVIEQLALMESNLTEIYQSLSPKLHFNAINFQQYVQRDQGTNFILLHFWFHTLIVLLHQPTLLHTFDAEIQQLFPNSRELSMSSAKTIADILAFTELIDAKSGVGNPFTSQPTYIAACAFLKERSMHTASSNSQSRAPSPLGDRPPELKTESSVNGHASGKAQKVAEKVTEEQKLAAKHSLLAAAANQNYQRCYRALQQLEHYWAGTKYILTVLDQKAKGVGDPLLYTQEEMESALEVPMRAPAFTSPGWRRKLSWGAYLSARPNMSSPSPFPSKAPVPGSPAMDPAQAIGWSLTGTMNSPRSANLAMLYSSEGVNTQQQRPPKGLPLPSIVAVTSGEGIPNIQSHTFRQPSYQTSPTVPTNVDARRISEADLLLNLHSPYPAPSPQMTNNLATATATSPNLDFVQNNTLNDPFAQFQPSTTMPYSGMMIESQDIDMSMLADDMMWLEYLPQDFTSGFGGAPAP